MICLLSFQLTIHRARTATFSVLARPRANFAQQDTNPSVRDLPHSPNGLSVGSFPVPSHVNGYLLLPSAAPAIAVCEALPRSAVGARGCASGLGGLASPIAYILQTRSCLFDNPPPPPSEHHKPLSSPSAGEGHIS